MPDFTPQAVLVVFSDGRREAGNYEKTEQKRPIGRNKGGIGRILLPSASARSRGQRPAVVSFLSDFIQQAVLVIFLDGRWRMGNIGEKPRKFAINARNQWGELAKYCFRQLPSASAASGLRWFRYCRILSSRRRWSFFWTEDGGWGILRKTEEIRHKCQKPGRNWRNIASVSFRQPPQPAACGGFVVFGFYPKAV